jgi:hypothetical protein
MTENNSSNTVNIFAIDIKSQRDRVKEVEIFTIKINSELFAYMIIIILF